MKCKLCGNEIIPCPVSGWDQGNDAWPLAVNERACDFCEEHIVKARIAMKTGPQGPLYREGMLEQSRKNCQIDGQMRRRRMDPPIVAMVQAHGDDKLKEIVNKLPKASLHRLQEILND